MLFKICKSISLNQTESIQCSAFPSFPRGFRDMLVPNRAVACCLTSIAGHVCNLNIERCFSKFLHGATKRGPSPPPKKRRVRAPVLRRRAGGPSLAPRGTRFGLPRGLTGIEAGPRAVPAAQTTSTSTSTGPAQR